MQGAHQNGWAKGQPEEAVFFVLWKTLQKSMHKPIDKCMHVRYNRGKLKERKLQ